MTNRPHSSKVEISEVPSLYETVQFVPIIHKFFTEIKNYEEATLFLKKYMKHKLENQSPISSRKIFYSLIIYKFGKELEYPDPLQTKARQLILFHLQNKDESTKDKKRVVKEFLDEFEKYRKEDFKNYIYELGVQYNQLVEMLDRLSDHSEWIESIKNLQDTILNQVIHVKGETIFQECLETLGQLKKQIVQEHLENAYWNIMEEEISQKKYDMMMKNYLLIKEILLEMRNDQDTKEILDEKYIQQLLDNDLFTEKTLIDQVQFIFHKMKIYGIPIYDKLIDKSKLNLVQEIQEKGLSPETVVNVFKKSLPMLQSYIDIIRIYRKRINKDKKL